MNTLYITQKIQIQLENIKYLQADINYTIIHTCQDGCIISSTTIKRLNDKIKSTDFIRINKKYVLNKKFIREYSDVKSSVILDDGQIFLLSRRKNRLLREVLIQSQISR